MSCVSMEDQKRFSKNTTLFSNLFLIRIIGRSVKKELTSSPSEIVIGSGVGQLFISGCSAESIRIISLSAGLMVSILSRFLYFGFESITVCVRACVTLITHGASPVSTEKSNNALTKPSTPGHITGTQYVGFFIPNNGVLPEVKRPEVFFSKTIWIHVSHTSEIADKRCSTSIICIS